MGVVRISVGVASNFADAYRFMTFAAGYVDREAEAAGELMTAERH